MRPPSAGAAGHEAIPTILDRHYRLSLAALCATGVAMTVLLSWRRIAGFTFADPDDIMRLLEVRAWLGGQSWFDVTQYRIAPPRGFAMHWSRLVDVPIAAVILVARPLVGARTAETLACVAVPAATLTLVMVLVAGIARRLFGSAAALLAACFCVLDLAAIVALRPMRIDHHGWEAAAGLAGTLFTLRRRGPAEAALAGLCLACWLHISIEGAVFTAGTLGWLALRWALTPEREGWRLPTTLGALAGSSVVLLLTTHPASALRQTFCDAVSPLHIALMGFAAAATALLVRLRPASPVVRLAGLAGIAAICAAGYVGGAPQCVSGPFATLPPLVYRLWYLRIAEGLPVWRGGIDNAAVLLACPALALAGGGYMLHRVRDGAARLLLADYLALLAIATAVGAAVLRATVLANLLALPGEAGLIVMLLRDTRRWPLVPRAAGRAALLFLLCPLGLHLAVTALQRSPSTPGPTLAQARCLDVDQYRALDRLPAALVLTPLDIGPSLVAGSHHQAVGAGYHRNPGPMGEVIGFFLADDAQAHRIARRSGARYMAYCDGDSLLRLLARSAPGSLGAGLMRASAPAWLHPIDLPEARRLHVFAIEG